MVDHTFGGVWTERKLKCLRKYLEAYRTIFTSNPRARYFRTWYVGSLHESALSVRHLGRSMNGLRAGMAAPPLPTPGSRDRSLQCSHRPQGGAGGDRREGCRPMADCGFISVPGANSSGHRYSGPLVRG
jgi:hypothetical protein